MSFLCVRGGVRFVGRIHLLRTPAKSVRRSALTSLDAGAAAACAAAAPGSARSAPPPPRRPVVDSISMTLAGAADLSTPRL